MSKSGATRKRIIAAAVQQIAGEDIYHRLRLERIAEKAGVSEATIHYHFGRKDNFSQAVWQSIVDEREPYTLANFYLRNRALLATPSGKHEFIHRMIECYCIFFQSPKSEYLRRLIRLFFIENIGIGKIPRKHVNQYFQSELDAFNQICQAISGRMTPLESSLLFLFIMHPLSIAYTHHVNPSKRISEISMEHYCMAVKQYAENELLYHLGMRTTCGTDQPDDFEPPRKAG